MKFFLCILLIGLVYADSPDRRAPGRHFDFTKCCKVEKSAATTKFIESMMKFADQCKQQLGESVQGKPPKFGCFHECVANKTNTLNADKSLNEAAYRTFVTTQMATEDYQKAAADGIATKCIEKVKKPDSTEEGITDGCSMAGMISFRCASKELTNSCPADKQDTTEQCVKFREFMNSNRKGMGPRPSRAARSK